MPKLFMFPGQGSQKIGMGRDLFDASPAAKAVFEEVDDALSFKLSEMIFEGDAAELSLTANVQPALMTVSIAAARALEEKTGKKFEALCDMTVGHSLGEYSALCASGALSLSDTARLLRARGQFMQDAVPVGQGGIVAVLGLPMRDVEQLCEDLAKDGGVAQVANDNCPGQIVISGRKDLMEKAVEMAKERGAKRALMLPVSVPVHSEMMAPAREHMIAEIAKVDFKTPVVPILSNYSARPETDIDAIKKHLLGQFTGRVRFTACISEAVDHGITEAFEIGSGKVLCGLVGRITKGITCAPLGTVADLETWVD